MRLRTAIWLPIAVLSVYPALAQTKSAASAPQNWVGTWAASPFDGDPWHGVPTIVDSTLREIVHTSIAGNAVRVHLTNEFGREPLRVDAVTVATSTGTSSVDTATLHNLTFGNSPSIVIPAGAEAVSDPVVMPIPAAANLAVSIYLPLQRVSNVSVHSSAQQDNFIAQGNHVRDASFTEPVVTPSWYFLKGVDVQASEANAAAVVAFGDSITDGALSTQNANHRWPDYLAARLKANPATANLSVLDQGIGGNCILIHCVGQNALARFDRDVLAQTGVKYLIVLEGINDIGRLHSPNLPEYKLTAEDLEQGLMQLVARAHVHGIKVFGATLTPYKGAGYFTEKGEQIREALNQWILTSGVFDGTIDFDKATRDPANPLVFSPQADGGDHLHPKDPGYQIMGDAIDLSLFR
ncbi:MAG TPA: SGNH/GDSL hydrolase family protein [Terracidiphilus sp.]|jgi:lysophospholipase L1-like esterase|nr:SGNH/GDSL hydrolase family protein [Terracidiphilus sp.]